MPYSYTYQQTSRIQDLLNRLEVVRKVLDVIPKRPRMEGRIRRSSLLRSALFSAKIEGNSLRMDEVAYIHGTDVGQNKEKKEVANIVSALEMIVSLPSSHTISKGFLFDLHKIVMRGLSSEAGLFRTEVSAIFNMAGVAVYMTPPPSDLSWHIDDLILHCQNRSIPTPVLAALVHVEFEKIHPFLDGNGRVGRLLSTYILYMGGYSLRGLASFEQYLEAYREEYYRLLSESGQDKTTFVEFFLSAVTETAEKSLSKLQESGEEKQEHLLLPRRQEIIAIIRDHPYCSFDFITRRFHRVTGSTLHNDLRVLIEKNYIEKVGSTRGASYVAKKEV